VVWTEYQQLSTLLTPSHQLELDAYFQTKQDELHPAGMMTANE
jgi:hypothetical protein